MAKREKVWTQCDIQIWLGVVLPIVFTVFLIPGINGIDITTTVPVSVTHIQIYDRCCNGTLGYATKDSGFTIVCSEMICCNTSETVAVIPVDVALGFKFRCMPRSQVHIRCYDPGIVRSSNEDPDHTPRVCCEDKSYKFDILVNQWEAAMVVKCVAR